MAPTARRGPATAPVKRLATAATLALALALGACATAPQAQVLRFHQGAPAAGAVYLKPANPSLAGSLEFQAQADAVAAELRRQGFTVVSQPSQAQFVATVDVSTAARDMAPRRSGVSVGVGGGWSSGNVGVGTSVNVPVGGSSRPQIATTTTLSVRMATPAGQAVWEGRASVETGPEGRSGTVLAPALAGALFRDFPGPSGRTVKVAL